MLRVSSGRSQVSIIAFQKSRSVLVSAYWYYRALAVKEDDNFVWFWIGSHPEYDRLLSGG